MISILSSHDWLQLFGHFLSLSLLAVGGAIGTAPEMHRYLVDRQAWLSDAQFSASIAIAQAAPGPNVLFVALLGWNVGVNAAGGAAAGWGGQLLGLAGVGVAMLGIILPSTTLTLLAGRWLQRNRGRRSVRAFKLGLAPVVVGLMVAIGWVLVRTGSGDSSGAGGLRLWGLAAVVALMVWRTRLHLLVLLAAGAVAGGLGWV